MRCKKGQSILEYVIVLTVIVAAIIYAATQFIKPAVQQGLDNSGKAIKAATGQLPGATGTGSGTATGGAGAATETTE